MSITIFEGADFTGKTTSIKNLIKQNSNNSVYIHFPIMSDDDYSEILKLSIKKLKLQKSDYENMRVLQNKFLFNIIENSNLILNMYCCGFDVYLDRYITSNIVYRYLFGLPNIQIPKVCIKVLNIASNNYNFHILVLPEKELARRMRQNIRNQDSLAKLMEKEKIIFAANKKYTKLLLNI